MAQSYYSLEQAADLLGKTPDDLKQMIRRQEIRAFADGGSWKFRVQDIEAYKQTQELLGGYEFSTDEESADDLLFEDASEGELPPLADLEVAPEESLQKDAVPKGSDESDVRLIFSDDKDGSSSDVRLVPDFTDEDLLLEPVDKDDDLSFEPEPVPTKPAGDSDIRLVLDDDEPAEVDLSPTEEAPVESGGPVAPPASQSGLIPLASMDEDDDLFGDDMLLDAGNTPTSGTTPAPVADSDEFAFDDDELGVGFQLKGDDDLGDLDLRAKTPTLKHGAGDDDSDSDFDLNLDDDIGLAQDVTPGAGDSGINLARPDDSGILLAKASNSGINLKPGEKDNSSSEFDVSLDSDDDILDSDELPAFKASDTAPRMSKPLEDSSDEISDSDFELAEDDEESGSDVIALDDEEEDSSEDFEEDEDEESEDDYAPVGEEAILATAQPAPWGGLWVGFLSVTTMVFVVVMMMMYEITRNAWSYNAPYTLNASIIQTIYDVGKSMGVMP